MGNITGYRIIGFLSERMSYPRNSYFKSCLDDEEERLYAT